MSVSALESPAIAFWAAAARTVLSALFVLALLLFLVGADLRSVALNRSFYLDGWSKYRVDQVTGLRPDQLPAVAQSFIDYFQAPPGRMDVEVELGGQRRPLFNERELQHMEDVQAIVRLLLQLQVVAGFYLIGFLAIGLAIERAAFLPHLGRLLLAFTALTIGLVALIGLFSLLDFSQFWYFFHRLAFRNDLWILDPRRDYLIMLFPQPFWFDATIRLAALAGLETVAAAVLGFVLTRLPGAG